MIIRVVKSLISNFKAAFCKSSKNHVTDNALSEKVSNESKTGLSVKSRILLHALFVKSTQLVNHNPTDVVENFYKLVKQANFQESDSKIIDHFINKVLHCLKARKHTFQSTNLCSDILHTCIYIIAWINETYKDDPLFQNQAGGLDVCCTARRKSLESELAKLLEMALKLNPTQINDRFGIRFIVMNPENAITLTCILTRKLINILCGFSREDRKNFRVFVEKNADASSKARILKLLDLPITLEAHPRHDKGGFNPEKYPHIKLPTQKDREILGEFLTFIKFYFDPKENSYQSIHLILRIAGSAEFYSGETFEFQLRTWEMHKNAENGIGLTHEEHKNQVKESREIFTLSEEEIRESNIIGFYSYNSPENDVDGFHWPKILYNRRIDKVFFAEGIPTLKSFN